LFYRPSNGFKFPQEVPMKLSALVGLILCVVALGISGCGKKHRRFPEGEIGWHSASYSKIFGKLQLVQGSAENQKPYWIIRYASTTGPDIYGGKMVLMPENMMTGYSGGEYVELTGRVRQDLQNTAGTGMLYEVQGIRIWIGHDRD
jgi:hypothetical protein